MPRKLKDVVLTIATLLVVFGLLVSINPGLQQHMQEVVTNPQFESIERTVGTTVESGAGVLFGYASGHAYQFTFLVAACVFFVLMLKVIS